MDRAAPDRSSGLSPSAASAASAPTLLAAARRRVVAHLARSLGLGHLALAEDAFQTAALRALERWPRDGVPDDPAAWLYRVARNAAIDALRVDGRHEPLPEAGEARELHAPPAAEGRFAGELDDDELALLFAACHPSLPPAAQVVLALRTLGGHELSVLAPLLFTTEAALAQRLARARTQLAGQRLQVPAGRELPARRESVLTVLALMFHQGQIASGRRGGIGNGPGDTGAVQDAMAPCWEAIRLARAVAAHPATAAPEADALAALLLLHGARLTGRIDEHGDIVPLRGQPRDRWDAGMLRLGFAHLAASQQGTRLTRWHLLAGIAGKHALAPDVDGTDWPAIVRYYDHLLALDPSAAPRLGHAIALAEAGAADDARQRLLALLPQVPTALKAHTLAALARACSRMGDNAAAMSWLAQAVAAAPHPADARQLTRQLARQLAKQTPQQAGQAGHRGPPNPTPRDG
jgi:RNA polymerase sigma-70 factor (ECF subfamily)